MLTISKKRLQPGAHCNVRCVTEKRIQFQALIFMVQAVE